MVLVLRACSNKDEEGRIRLPEDAFAVEWVQWNQRQYAVRGKLRNNTGRSWEVLAVSVVYMDRQGDVITTNRRPIFGVPADQTIRFSVPGPPAIRQGEYFNWRLAELEVYNNSDENYVYTFNGAKEEQ